MNRRAALRGFAMAVGVAPLLAACGGPAPPPPTVVKISLQATDAVNPDGSGTPEPVRVRIFRLAATETLSQTDFFALDADPKKALGQDLVGFDNLVLAPGAAAPYEKTCEPEVKFIGVVGSYFAINRVQWRAWKPVKGNATNAFTATLDDAGITLKEGAAR
jgi:type VI secretion system protein VasD